MNAARQNLSLAPWAKKNCKSCNGKGRMRKVINEGRRIEPCDCVARRLKKLQAKLSPFK